MQHSQPVQQMMHLIVINPVSDPALPYVVVSVESLTLKDHETNISKLYGAIIMEMYRRRRRNTQIYVKHFQSMRLGH